MYDLDGAVNDTTASLAWRPDGAVDARRRALVWYHVWHRAWQVLDHAIVIDPLSRPCRHFVSHPHCEDLARRYFCGDFPGSTACMVHPKWYHTFLHLLLGGMVQWEDVCYREEPRRLPEPSASLSVEPSTRNTSGKSMNCPPEGFDEDDSEERDSEDEVAKGEARRNLTHPHQPSRAPMSFDASCPPPLSISEHTFAAVSLHT